MLRRMIVLGFGAIFVLFAGFVAMHAVVPAGESYSRHTASDSASLWVRGKPISGEPKSIFDGTTPISDPWIVRDEGRYRMWFTLVKDAFTERQTIGIAHAESEDGLRWKTNNEHVLAPNRGGWDSVGVETACVVRRPDGGWFMYYTAPLSPEGNHHHGIGLATSDDGRKWIRHGTGPLLVGKNEWETPFQDSPNGPRIGGVLEPCVHFDERKKVYRMWYAGLGKRPDEFGKYRIGYAESEDGITWRRDQKPVFEPSAIGRWDDAITSHTHVAFEPDGKLHLFYFGSSTRQYQECEELGGAAMTPGSLGHAVSEDGRNWKRSSANPILSPRKDSWDSWAVGGPFVMWDQSQFRMWYFSNPRHNSYNARIGVATWKP